MQKELVHFPDGTQRYIKRSFRISAARDERNQIPAMQTLLDEQQALTQRYIGPSVTIELRGVRHCECGLCSISALMEKFQKSNQVN